MSQEFNWCFGCGKDNPIGLKLKFVFDDDCYCTYFTPQAEHQSYNNQMHGGLIATLLDETLGDHAYKLAGKPAFTAKLELRYKNPVPVGETVKIFSNLVRKKGRLYEMKGKLLLADGSVAAEANAKFLLAE